MGTVADGRGARASAGTPHSISASRFGVRTRLAVHAVHAANRLSRALRRGSGTVAGGHAGLALDPHLLSVLAGPRRVALVTGTNGKTTTTVLLAAALRGAGHQVASNTAGSNMPAGHVGALAESVRAGNVEGPAVLEVDEGYLPALLAQTGAQVAVLLNLSRDQLDRTNEVRMTARKWCHALSSESGTEVVANCDDPLVAWAATGSVHVTWVAAGSRWRADAVGCPACDGRMRFDEPVWSCPCGFGRPEPDVTVDVDAAGEVRAVWSDGRSLPVRLAIPGRFNRANAVMAALGAEVLGVRAAQALQAMAGVREVQGRFATIPVGGIPTRLLLAKNPAGWAELLELVCDAERSSVPLVVAINARVADGRDPSWLWDVPFEELAGREVIAAGERCRDLSVRLRYAEVPHRMVPEPAEAIRAASRSACPVPPLRDWQTGEQPARSVDFVGNYTVFEDLWRSCELR